MKRFLLWLFLLPAFAPLVADAGGSRKPKAPTEQVVKEAPVMGSSQDSRPAAVPLQLLVAFKDAKAATKRAEIFKAAGGHEVEKVGSSELYLVAFPEGSDLKAAQDKLAKSEGVRYAEPNLIMRTFKN